MPKVGAGGQGGSQGGRNARTKSSWTRCSGGGGPRHPLPRRTSMARSGARGLSLKVCWETPAWGTFATLPCSRKLERYPCPGDDVATSTQRSGGGGIQAPTVEIDEWDQRSSKWERAAGSCCRVPGQTLAGSSGPRSVVLESKGCRKESEHEDDVPWSPEARAAARRKNAA